MQTAVQVSLLAFSSMLAERFIEKYLSTCTETNHPIDSDTTSFQTATWRYSDTPNSFLFDFSGILNSVTRERLQWMIKASLPPHVLIRDIKLLRGVEALVELILENSDQNNAKTFMLHSQTRSILEHKGLYIQALSVWVKPTLTLSISEQVTYWRMQVYEFFPTDTATNKLASNITGAISRAFYRKKDEKGTLHVRQVFIEVGTATVLIEERQVPLIDPQRKLLFFPFLHRYLPIEILLIQK
jgi:hypothetical protein